jgi:hypothetical protein
MSAKDSLCVRWRFATRWALAHLLVSATVAGLAAGVVFGWWFGAPWRHMLGVGSIFGLLVVVDVVCGPFLTLVLASPHKSRQERWMDLSFVALIQLAALSYGMWSVFSARPVVLAFEADRLVVVTANDVQVDQLQEALPSLRRLPWSGVQLVALRKARSPEEFMQSIDQAMQGVTQSMRPSWWRPFEEAALDIEMRSKPLLSLLTRRPESRASIEGAIQKSGIPLEELRYLPLTSSKTDRWIALINPSGAIVGYAEADGFD